MTKAYDLGCDQGCDLGCGEKLTDWKLPDRPNNFSVILSKELLEKGLQHSGLLIRKSTIGASESRI
jgi:hypothetical protein